MSDLVQLRIMYTPQGEFINNQIKKQQPASKLVNRYLSTAAQYLHRTKSFHIPSTNTNENTILQNISYKNIQTNNLARSIPTNIQNINTGALLHTSSNNLPMSDDGTTNLLFNSNSNSINNNNNKSQGLVNTLRRSLRKNKERFYNKRSLTMKSCHSLNTYEQTINNDRHEAHLMVSMTPTLPTRRLNEKYSIRNYGKGKINDHQSLPLQPLTINGREQRNRILTNGPLSYNQITTNLPQASSIQSLSTNPYGTAALTNPILNFEQQSISSDFDEKEKLKNDLQQLKNELLKSRETIARLQKSEEQMRERLAEQAQRQLEKGGKFEDLNQISRPTELIRSYNSLYSQARIDALDALDNINEMSHSDDLKSKLLFSVVVLAFRHAQNQAKEIRNKIRQILQLSNDKSSILLEETIEKYLRSTIQKYDIGKIAFEVENQLWTTLYDYPALKSCNELLKYITTACRTAWGLVNQTPSFYIEFQTLKFDKQIHERFHTSDNESDTIIEYVWPCLIDGRDRTCVAKGVVITDERYLSISKHLSS